MRPEHLPCTNKGRFHWYISQTTMQAALRQNFHDCGRKRLYIPHQIRDLARLGKLLLLLFLAFVAYLVMKALKAPARRDRAARPKRDLAPERMVSCDHCGVNLPESESVRAGDRHFCSEEHRRLAG